MSTKLNEVTNQYMAAKKDLVATSKQLATMAKVSPSRPWLCRHHLKLTAQPKSMVPQARKQPTSSSPLALQDHNRALETLSGSGNALAATTTDLKVMLMASLAHGPANLGVHTCTLDPQKCC